MTMNLSEEGGETLPYQLRRAHGNGHPQHPFDRAIADSSVLHATVTDPKNEGVRIRRRHFEEPGPADRKLSDVIIKPQEIFGRRVIFLHVASWPEPDSHHHHAWNDPIDHFEVYYELSQQATKPEHRLIPHATRKEGMRSFGYVVPGASMESRRTGRRGFFSKVLHWRRSMKEREERKLLDDLMATVKKRPICPEDEFEPEYLA